MLMKRPFVLVCGILLSIASRLMGLPGTGGAAGDAALAANAINSLGLELLGTENQPGANALLSPYSIQIALAMTYAGADGETKAEMARVLHFGGDEANLHRSFGVLQAALADVVEATLETSENAKKMGGTRDPLTLTVANQLFGQTGYEFRPAFIGFTKESYGAPLELLDFARDPMKCRGQINAWVEKQTRDRIRDLIPSDGLTRDTRLVLVNAIYMKAPWIEEFPASATQTRPFHTARSSSAGVPTMTRQDHFGYAKREGFTTVTIPYTGGAVQFLVILPDEIDGLAAVEAKLTAEIIGSLAAVKSTDVILHLPKFKMEPPLFRLAKALQSLGMKSAFDQPKGSANFDRMAPRRPDEYLCISEVFHKTFLSLDEKGTEAAAATAVTMNRVASAARPKPKPIEVSVDHPFLFAVQHRPSGACLFLGRVADPR
jgi:serpin B